MIPGRVGIMTQGYKRRGPVDLFAAMNATTGQVLHDTRCRHTGRGLLGFLEPINMHMPKSTLTHLSLPVLRASSIQAREQRR